MRTVVLLGVFLLAASATPINDVLHDNIDDTPHTNNGNGDAKDHDGISADTSNGHDQDNVNTHEEHSNDTHGILTDDNTTEETGEAVSSSVSTVPTLPTEIQESTQETNESITPPPDSDPEDCTNASKPHHAFLLCTYSCQGDQMFMAPNESVCFLNPDNVTTGNRITQEYNHTHHASGAIGVCSDGQCLPNSTNSPAATTESSPVPNTSAKITTETETSDSEQVSATTINSSDISASFPKPTDHNNSSTENVDNSENTVVKVSQDEGAEVSSTAPSSPIALPADLPAVN